MIKENIDEILIKIQNLEIDLDIADLNFNKLSQEYKDEIAKFPFEKILKENGVNLSIDSDNIKNSVINLYQENEHKRFDNIISEFSKYPEYQKLSQILDQRDIARIKYYIALYRYLNYIDKVRNELFSNNYLKKIDYLADAGYLLYHYHIPDFVIENTPQDKLEEYISDIYSENDYGVFDYSFKVILGTTNYENELQEKKIRDLKEAVDCLKRGSFNSCTRTMFPLIESEYCAASELSNQSKNNKRTEKISEFIKKLGNGYYSHAWEKIKKFYEKCNVNTEQQNKFDLNRNDLAHGVYNKSSTKEDCIKLLLLYQNLKDIRYILNNTNLLTKEFERDKVVRDAILEIKN